MCGGVVDGWVHNAISVALLPWRVGFGVVWWIQAIQEVFFFFHASKLGRLSCVCQILLLYTTLLNVPAHVILRKEMSRRQTPAARKTFDEKSQRFLLAALKRCWC